MNLDLLSSRRVGALAIVAVIAFPLVEAIRIVVQQPHVVLYGDQALIELGARGAAHFDQLVGPYSREGFHHPGPAVFYLLAPFVRLFEPSGPGIYFGAVIINAVALGTTVAFVWRRFGALTALWAAFVIDLYCLCAGTGTFREPWNPYLILAPMILFAVLWSASFTNTKGTSIWAFVVGSYVLQTEVAAGGVVMAMLLVLFVRFGINTWRNREIPLHDQDMSTRSQATGAIALVLIWIPPVIELWTDNPTNFRLLWDYFTNPHPEVSLHSAIRLTDSAAIIMPYGNSDYVVSLIRTNEQLIAGSILVIAAFLLALFSGRAWRQPMSIALAAAGAIGLMVGALSLTRATPPVDAYLTVWISFAPVCFLLAIGIALFAPADTPLPASPQAETRPLLIIGSTLVTLVAIVAVSSDLRAGSIDKTTGSGPWPVATAPTAQQKAITVANTNTLASAAVHSTSSSAQRVDVNIDNAALWPYAAGIVLALDQHGVQATVSPASWALYFGNNRAPGAPVSARVGLYTPDDPAIRTGGPVIARIDGAVLTLKPAA